MCLQSWSRAFNSIFSRHCQRMWIIDCPYLSSMCWLRSHDVSCSPVFGSTTSGGMFTMPASRICSFGTKSLNTLDDCNVSQEFADVWNDEHSEAHGWGTFPKCKAKLGYCLILGPLFWECPHPRALPYTKFPFFHLFKSIVYSNCTFFMLRYWGTFPKCEVQLGYCLILGP